MEFNFKDYKIVKTKNYIKKNNLFFLFEGVHKAFNDKIVTEQKLKNINFNSYKIFNKTSKKVIQNSIYKKSKQTINGITFFIKSKNNQVINQTLTNQFELLLFNMLAIKINNKIYQKAQFKNNYSLNYTNSKQLIFQFRITNLKKSR